MTSPSVELQSAVYERLTTEAIVVGLVAGRVYDNVPADAVFPYISFGPSDYYTDDSDCIPSRIETLQIDCWAMDHGKLRPARELADAVKRALHEYEVEFSESGLVEMRVTRVVVMADPGDRIAHGIVTLQAIIEESEW